MPDVRRRSAARRAALFFFVAGLLAVVDSVVLPAAHAQQPLFVGLGFLDLAIAVVLWRLPWSRWPARALLVIIPLAFVIIGLFYAVGATPLALYPIFFILLFIWVGLSLPPWTALALTPLTAAAYVLPLRWTGPSLAGIDSTFVTVAISTVIGEVIAHVLHQLRMAQDDLERQVAERTAILRSTNTALQYELVERARGEAALRASEERFRALFAHSPDAVILIDPHHPDGSWPIVECNAVACAMNGYTRDELIGQPIDLLNAVPGNPRERADSIAQLRRAGTIQFVDAQCRKNGNCFPIEVVASLCSIGDRELVLGSYRDISERNHADAVRAQLAAIVASSDDAILSKTTEGVITSWNAGAERLYGYTTAEAIGLSAAALIPSDRPLEEAHILDQITRGDRMEHFETVRVRKDGQRLAVSVTISPVKDRAGQIVSISAIARDITARKQAEEQLLYQANLLHTVSDAIIATDQDLNIIRWNQAAEALYGWCAEEVLGMPVDDLLQTTYADNQPEQVLQHVLEHGSWKGEAIQKRKDGTSRAILAAVSVVKDNTGRPVGGVTVNHDITERTHAEAARRAAEAKYRTLVEQMPAIIYTASIDETSTRQYVSPQIEAILGFTPDEWIANPNLWLEQAHPADRARLLENVGRVQASDSTTPTEYRSYTRDGRLVWLRDIERVVRDDTGQPLFVQGITLDITDRKLAEAAVLEREAYFRALIEHSADAIALVAVDGMIRYGSPATPRVLGYAVPAFVGRNAFDLIHPDDRAQFAEKLEQIVGVPEATVRFQARVQHADGAWRELEGMVTNLLAEPAVHAIVTNYRDISERKRAEIAVRESERRYRTLASNFPNGAVVLFDQDLRFTIADGTGLVELGLTRERLEGYTLWDIYPPEARRVNEPIFRAALAGTPSIREVTQGAMTLVIHTLPVRDEHGAIIAGMLMSQNITERKRMEAALLEERALLAQRVDERTADLSAANAELARTAVLKDAFLASMSHELRTPLNAVLGLSEALQEEVYGPLNDRQRRSLHSIEASGRHLLALINDILDLAKIGAGKLELVLEPTSVESICQASLRLIAQLAHTKQLSVDLTLDPAVTLLPVDARRLKQILVNLLSNAVKFTPAGGSIGLEVAGDVARQAVDLTVWDTGIGIAEEQMPQLFQAFVQLDSRLARQYEGTGLGLALVFRMVELHGGSVGVMSTVGRGSRFTVALPWPTPHADGQVCAPAAPDMVTINRATMRRALLVENSPTTAEQITRYLHELALESVTVRDGTAVVALAIAEPPDLILLDLLLPDSSGWDVLAGLKDEPRTCAIPVVIISASDERARGLALGAAAYLIKPVTQADLERILPVLAPGASAGLLQPATHGFDPPTRGFPHPVVLLAEDNEATISMIVDYLGTRGYQVVVARNGAEAIARAREARPAIVLMDIQMPGMDGLDATRRIRAISELVDLPIIALTALAMPGDRERCLAAGANEYLSKPVILRELAALIATHVSHHGST